MNGETAFYGFLPRFLACSNKVEISHLSEGNAHPLMNPHSGQQCKYPTKTWQINTVYLGK